MYVRTGTSFRGAKMCKIEEKGVFLVMFTNFGKDMMELKHTITHIWGLFSYLKNMCLGCVLKVLLRG